MIGGLIRNLHRRYLQVRVGWRESELECIAQQRQNDWDVEITIRKQVAIDRHRIQVMANQEARERSQAFLRKLGL